jgi:hypothetical protein
MILEEFNSYYKSKYPNSEIEQGIYAIEQHIRFELADDFKNGTKKRVKNSVNKALILFNDAFENQNEEIWILIYDYNESENYIYSQFLENRLEYFESQIENLNADENGIAYTEKEKLKIAIGKFKVNEIKILEILNGIANNEMGFEPKVDQDVFFINQNTDIGFHMYDDRGCYIWSDKAEKIKQIYQKRNNWIVEYHRKEIDKYF